MITIQKDLIKGIVYSQFELKLGPTAVAWLPSDLSLNVRELVSLKAINILGGEKGSVPQSLVILPFPSFNLKGLIKCIEIRDESYRGGSKDCTLTVLFDEVDDIIFYKYINNFQSLFNQIVMKIIAFEEKNEPAPIILDVLEDFYNELSHLLNELCDAEYSCGEATEFPKGQTEEQVDKYRFKIVVVGDPAVGKTSLILHFTDRAFRRTYLPTIGVNISEKSVKVKDHNVRFIIWDIAGQSKFEIMRKHFYGGANGQLLMFDLTRSKTLNSIVQWYADVKSYLNQDLPGFILGNKSDLLELRDVTNEEISTLVKKLNIDYIETSALSGENVNAAFIKLGKLLLTRYKQK
ncbi:MAG: Rab family GTPase, partial [Candidatus Helarchaeota archaeon]